MTIGKSASIHVRRAGIESIGFLVPSTFMASLGSHFFFGCRIELPGRLDQREECLGDNRFHFTELVAVPRALPTRSDVQPERRALEEAVRIHGVDEILVAAECCIASRPGSASSATRHETEVPA
ncbi:MAG: hypothetical protein R3C97_15700 [Geminicoccaceae bacterium]